MREMCNAGAMAHLLGSLAAAAAGRWKRSLAIVVAVLVGIGVLAGAVGGEFSDDFTSPGTESQQAYDLLQDRFPAQSGDTATVVFSVEDGTLREGDRPAAIARTVEQIAGQPHVSGVRDPLARGARGQVSQNGRIAYATVQYDEPASNLGKDPGERLAEVAATAEAAGVDVNRNGQIVDMAEQQEAPVGELIGIAVAVVVLTLVFHSFAAMLLTLFSALLALAGGVMLLTIGSAFADFPSFAPTLGVMLGLGAGIDYALLIVGRYREQLAAGDTVPHAARVANQTAGTSVVAAGAIVVVAISGLLATGLPFVGRMGLGSAVVVAVVAVGAVTVLPVLMGAFARRLRPRKIEHVAPSPAFARWARMLTARPWLAAIGGTLILLLLAMPFTTLRLGQPDDGNDAPSTTTRQAYDKLAEGFGPGFNGPLLLAVSVPEGGKAALEQVRGAVEDTPDVAAVAPPRLNDAGDAATIGVIPKSSPQDERTSELVSRLRDEVLPAATAGSGLKVYVGGATATFDDLAGKIAGRLPIFIALVIGLSVILLMAVFRSLWVPLVSAAFNLLSILAAYGVVVAVFQDGWGAGLLGIESGVPIVSFVPMFMFAILFGLSMDYNVFLQSRIREEYHRGAGPRQSVIDGVSRVARIILAAGAIMTAVFLGFVSDPDVVVKTIGLGLASAILIDVLVVRLIVAPAVIVLLGDKAWWLPGWLDRILPKISLEGDEHDPPARLDEPSEAVLEGAGR
jgi:putative drug exporter of the RND superfamily